MTSMALLQMEVLPVQGWRPGGVCWERMVGANLPFPPFGLHGSLNHRHATLAIDTQCRWPFDFRTASPLLHVKPAFRTYPAARATSTEDPSVWLESWGRPRIEWARSSNPNCPRVGVSVWNRHQGCTIYLEWCYPALQAALHDRWVHSVSGTGGAHAMLCALRPASCMH